MSSVVNMVNSTVDFMAELEQRMAADIAKAEAEARLKVIERYRKTLNGEVGQTKEVSVKNNRQNNRQRISSQDVARHKSATLNAIKSAGDAGMSLSEIVLAVGHSAEKHHLSRALKLLAKEGLIRREGERRFAKYVAS